VTNTGYENVKSPLLQCPLCHNPFWKKDAEKVLEFAPEKKKKSVAFPMLWMCLQVKRKRKEKEIETKLAWYS